MIGKRIVRLAAFLLFFWCASLLFAAPFVLSRAFAAVPPQAEIQQGDDPIPGWIQPTPTPVSLDSITDVAIPPLEGGRKPDRAPVFVSPANQTAEVAAAAGGGLSIDLWYGNTQQFGKLGEPQPWINLLGNVTGTVEAVTLTYSLNGGALQDLHVGADGYRLAHGGDFNIELPVVDLINGTNKVAITATNALSDVVSKIVTVKYEQGNVWPDNVSIDWANVSSIQNVAQVVDGEWVIENGLVHPVSLGYDRLIAIGDLTWKDYEATVQLKVKAIDPVGYQGIYSGPNLGLGVRWQGHFDAQNGTQPRTGWQDLGALALYRWLPDQTEALQMFGYGGEVIGFNPEKTIDFDTMYTAKLSVQSAPNDDAYYRFKLWKATDPEPLLWDMESFGKAGQPATGSFVFQAHFADVYFGPITIEPLATISPTITLPPLEHGTLRIEPSLPAYTYGQQVEVTAIGNIGYQLDHWSGDLSGSANPLTIYMTKDVMATAVFTTAPPPVVILTDTLHGDVTVDPVKTAYNYGEKVTFFAKPDPGYRFVRWGGNRQSNTNPLVVIIDGDLFLEPVFDTEASPLSDDFNSCALDTALWTFSDPSPSADTTFSINGQQLTFSVPAGTDHDLWEGKNFAPRLMQAATNTDFDLIAKFESIPSLMFQMQGIIVEQNSDNFIRTDFYSDGTSLYIFSATIIDGIAGTQINETITPTSSNSYLRVTRAGDVWTIAYSFNGSDWTTAGSYTQPLAVTKTGPFAANAGIFPANTVVVDYFENTSVPIVGEDAKTSALTINTVGDGTVAASPNKASYACDETITLTASPASGWALDRWSGALSGSQNPITLKFDLGDTVTATFVEFNPDIFIFLPIISAK